MLCLSKTQHPHQCMPINAAQGFPVALRRHPMHRREPIAKQLYGKTVNMSAKYAQTGNIINLAVFKNGCFLGFFDRW